ncbi:MAG: prepilin-type N-terminal cleavage/methylation domain-containing protein, partial [Acidobacteria bacterium]|nr:prepilin-type N-terminal cleavage/methylation domain-containing protein [Acidobacteriota bacterium]
MALGLTMKKEKGFTLIEVLVVLAILAVIAVIATINVGNTLKKQRLEAAANQLQSFIESASVYARERSRGVFVWIHRGQAPGGGGNWWYCYLIEDTNRNDILDYQINNPNAIPPGAGTAADGDNYINSEKAGLAGGGALPQDILLPEVNEP